MQLVDSFIEIAKIARKQVYRNITVFPLLAPDGSEPDYFTFEQALEQNLIRVTVHGLQLPVYKKNCAHCHR